MNGLLRSLHENWNLVVACCLVYAVIGIYLGPGFFFLTWFLNLCGLIIHTALRR